MLEHEPLAFYVIEPHFYDDLNWDKDKIVSYLEFIRLNINNLFHHKHSKYYIISYGDFLGNKLPAIGVVNKDYIESKDFEDFDYLFNKVEKWVNTIGLDIIDIESKKLNPPTWKKILELKHYPKNQMITKNENNF